MLSARTEDAQRGQSSSVELMPDLLEQLRRFAIAFCAGSAAKSVTGRAALLRENKVSQQLMDCARVAISSSSTCLHVFVLVVMMVSGFARNPENCLRK